MKVVIICNSTTHYQYAKSFNSLKCCVQFSCDEYLARFQSSAIRHQPRGCIRERQHLCEFQGQPKLNWKPVRLLNRWNRLPTPWPKGRKHFANVVGLDTFQSSNEIFFFTRVLPFYSSFRNDVEQLFAKYYFAQIQLGLGPLKSVLIFGDLTAAGYRLAEIKVFLDYQHLALMRR